MIVNPTAEEPVVIIAEAGVNHNGSVERALELIDAAADAGVDYIKFQTFKAERLASPKAGVADYARRNLVADSDQVQMLRRLELDRAAHERLIEHCRERSVKFLSTGFDAEALAMLVEMGIDQIKISSGDLTNLPYLRKAVGYGLPIILSTGMGSLAEVEAAVLALREAGAKSEDLTLLHCTTEYPAPFESVNLRAMVRMKEQLGLSVGYSDHTLGLEVAIAATALGATVIEKHFTMDRSDEGPDHKASLEPSDLAEMVRQVRHTERALGDGVKRLQEVEEKNLRIARKSIHIKTTIRAGNSLDEGNLVMLRPGDGISPMEIDRVVGQIALSDLEAGHQLAWGDLEQQV